MWNIKAIYPLGGHTVMLDGEKMRFQDKREAEARAEVLNATTRDMAIRAGRANDTRYIVVEETI